MSKGVSAFVGLAIFTTATAAHADDVAATKWVAPPFEAAPARFGARGQLALLGSTTIGASYQSYESSASYVSASFAPTIDYFVAKNFAIGLALSAAYSDSRGFGPDGSFNQEKSSSFSAGPRVSYNVPLGRYLSFYPSASFSVGANHRSEILEAPLTTGSGSPFSAPSTTQADAFLQLSATLFFHPRSHVLLGIGPTFLHDFASSTSVPSVNGQATTVGGGISVGGYFGGKRSAQNDDGDDGPHRRSLRKFGDAHEVVLTNAFLTQGSGTVLPRGASASSLQVLIAADYFALPHFSIGAFVASSFNWGHTDSETSFDNETFGVGFRLGYQLALVDGVSIYPRATLRVGEMDNDSTYNGASGSLGIDFLTVGAYVPLEVEIAPHFLVGFGPNVARDLVTTTSTVGQQNRSTTVGAEAELGVWL